VIAILRQWAAATLNQDHAKAQFEAADEIERLQKLIAVHNAECDTVCGVMYCGGFKNGGLSCPECPKEWKIET
jgi:hypothetical protein